MIYNIEDFKNLNKPECMVITQHSRKRLAERKIRIRDICNAVNSGEIIENYEDDRPFPSCLILGKSEEKNIHICASINDNMLYLITAYIPDPNKWEYDLKRRKAKSE